MQRLLEGDRGAGRAFAGHFVPLLRMKLRQRWPGAPEAQVGDLIQETLLRVLDALKAGKVHDLARLGGSVSGCATTSCWRAGHARGAWSR